jgi:PhoH-like ATPase
MAKKQLTTTKLFVLDTNVLIHDPSSLFRFEEHDIFLPMVTLEELDNNKKGLTEVARSARQASRNLEGIVGTDLNDLELGCPLSVNGNRHLTGRLFLQTKEITVELPGLAGSKADNQILGVVFDLQKNHPNRQVILVSKDINIRIKARAIGMHAEDYFNDKVLEDTDLLYSGIKELPGDFWDTHSKAMESWQDAGRMFYRINGPLCKTFLVNEFVYYEFEKPFHAIVRSIEGNSAVLEVVKDHLQPKHNVWGINARNREQNFALNLLMDPKIYSEIIMTRVTVSVGEDIGFLPGTEEEKMGPWMGALDDNLDVLNKSDETAGEWGRAATQDLIRSRIKVKSLNFMRGRTFLNKFLIIDEAQNLTPKQMKTLITRAGPGTKVVCLGNIAQIDTPYLTEGSSGLTYVVDRFKGWGHNGHITLLRGERSRLADFAAEAL